MVPNGTEWNMEAKSDAQEIYSQPRRELSPFGYEKDSILQPQCATQKLARSLDIFNKNYEKCLLGLTNLDHSV